MSTSNPLVYTNEDGLDEASIAGAQHIETPTYSPEIASDEDLEVVLRYRDVLDEGAPILVPGYRWQEIRTKPKFREVEPEIRDLIRNHSTLYYEPVELFRYRRPRKLVSHAFRGSQSKSREFYKKLRDDQYDTAIDLLPTFFQPFIEAQLEPLLERVDGATVPPRLEDTATKATEAWRDKRANSGYESYFAEIAKDAQRSPNSAVIPPVPPVQKSSEPNVISRVRGANIGMRTTVDVVNEARFGDPLRTYFHAYADYSILKSDTDVNEDLLTMMRQELEDGDYAGLAVTLSNYQRAWDSGLSVRVESFINDIANIAMEKRLPFILPRSGWYGGYLTDHGAHVFSSLLNGNEKYNPRSGGVSQEAAYGTTPFYGDCLDLGVGDAFEALKNTGGQATHIPGLPDAPPRFNERAGEWDDRLGGSTDYRKEFSKARRLLHAEEAREWRESIRRGRTATPARMYFKKSEHNDLS
jgi:hypothetical protein